MGNTGSGDSKQLMVTGWMEKRCQDLGEIDGILLLGDNFHMKGVESISDPLWEKVLEGPYGMKKCVGRSKVFPILGNIDYKGNPQAQIDYTSMSNRWVMPYRFYALNWGEHLKVIAFDSFFSDLCFLNRTCSIDFLMDQVENSKASWTIVMGHHPLSSASIKGGSSSGEDVNSRFLRYLFCDKAHIWLSGHAHHLEHRKLENCATELFVSGGGGRELGDIHFGQKASKFASKTNGFLELEVRDDVLISRFFSGENEIAYETKFVK